MSLRLFMDQCIPRSVAEALRNAGHAVDLLRDHLPINAKDPDVLTAAQSLEAVLVTLNGDFADIINYPPEKFGGIIALQVKNHPESLPSIIMRLLTYLGERSDQKHYRGKLLLIEAHRISNQRIKRIVSLMDTGDEEP
jgi:predicted nuclease of predicted toxin-antitoxin system